MQHILDTRISFGVTPPNLSMWSHDDVAGLVGRTVELIISNQTRFITIEKAEITDGVLCCTGLFQITPIHNVIFPTI